MFQRARRRLVLPFIAPQLILYVLVMFVPLALTVYYGFTDWEGHGNPVSYAGLKNYRILLKDDNFHNAIWNSIKLTLIYAHLEQSRLDYEMDEVDRVRRERAQQQAIEAGADPVCIEELSRSDTVAIAAE